MSKGVNRVEFSGFASGIDAEEDADCAGEANDKQDAAKCELRLDT